MSRTPSARRGFSLVGLIRKLFTGGPKKPYQRKERQRPLYLEQLEDRTLPTVVVAFNDPDQVLFQSLTPFDTDDLHLRVVNNVLQYSLDGSNWTADLDPASGEQSLTVSQATDIRTDVGGTVFVNSMNRAGGKIVSLGDLVVQDNVTLSTRNLAGGDPATAPSTGNSLSLTIQAPHLRVGNGVQILAHADSGFEGGDIQLIADTGFDLTWLAVTPLFNVQNAEAMIDVGSATIKGRNISLTTNATTRKYADFDINAEALNDVLDRFFAKVSNPESTELTFDPDDGGDTITRSAGDWLQDGFETGQLISVQGSLHNEGVYRVASVTPAVITLTQRNVLNAETDNNIVVAETLAVMSGTPGLTFERNTLGRDKIIRSTGSWVDDGFAVGQHILVEHANDSDGRYQIADVTPTELTLVEGGSLDNSTFAAPAVMGGTPSLTFEDRSSTQTPAKLSNPEDAVVAFGADGTIRRMQGNWIAEGFRVGQLIGVQGTQNNDGQYRIVGVSATTLTLADSSGLVDEILTGVHVEQVAVRDAISRTTGSWLADGFRPGMTIRVEGSGGNDGEYVIDQVDALVLTLDDDAELTTETKAGLAVQSLHPRVAQVFDALPQPNIPMTVRDRLGNLIPDLRLELNDVANNLKVEAADLRQINEFSPAQGMISDASSRVTVYSGATLDATENVVISANAVSEATLKTFGFSVPVSGGIGLPFAVGFGASEAEARAVVYGGATVRAGNLFNLTSGVQNTLDLQMFSYSGLVLGGSLISKAAKSAPNNPLASRIKHPITIPTPSLSVAYGRARSDSEAALDPGASVTAGTAFVTTTNTNNFNVEAKTKTLFPRKNAGSGMGVAVSDVSSDALARVDGDLTTSGDATVSAVALNERNRTAGLAHVKNELPGSGLLTKISNKVDQANVHLGSQTNDVGIAAGVAIAVSSNVAEARVGRPDATPQQAADVNVGGNLTVTAEAEDNFSAFAVGGMESKARFALGGAVNFSTYTNQARAFLGRHAEVDVARKLTLESDAKIPNQVTLDDTALDLVSYFEELQLDPPGEHLDADSPQEFVQGLLELSDYGLRQGQDAVGTFLPLKDTLLNLFFRLEGVTTSYTNASAEGDTRDHDGVFSFAGTINLMFVDNEAESFIGEHARVNQTPTLGGHLQLQAVTVNASAAVESINIAGLATNISLFSKQGAGGAVSDGSSVGTNLVAAVYDNKARAYIDDGARVRSNQDVTVKSDNRVFSLGLSQAGGEAKRFGFAFTAAVHDFATEALAWIEESAVVRSSLGDVIVEADTDLKSIDLSLGLQGSLIPLQMLPNGGKAAVGAAAMVNFFETTTHAVIGDVQPSTVTTPGLVKAHGDVRVDAEAHEVSVGLSMAGAISKGQQPTPPAGPSYPATTPSSADTSATGRQGADDALRFILGAHRSSWTPAREPSSHVVIGAHRGGNSAGRGPAKLFMGGHRAASGLAGAAAVNSATATGGQSSFGLAVSGDLALNVIDNDTQAVIAGTTIEAGRNVSVTAESHNITGVATTALSIGLAGTAVNGKGPALAGSLTFDVITRTTRAFTEDATITATNVFVTADGSDRQVAVAVGGAGSSLGNLNVAGSINVHALTSETVAALGDDTTVNAAGDVTVEADSIVQIISVAGALALGGPSGGGTQLSFGAGLDGGAIVNFTEASIASGANVNAGGSVHVLAANQEDVLSLAGALALSPKQVGVSGSGSGQVIVTEAVAYIGDGATVTADDSIVIDSEDETRGAIIAGAGAGGRTAGVGVSLGTFGIYRTVLSYVGEGATVTALGRGTEQSDPDGDLTGRGLLIDATAVDRLAVFAGSGAGAQTLTVAASVVPVVLASQTEAYVGKNARINSDNTGAHAGQSVQLRADHDTFLATGVGGLAISAGTSGVGVGAAANLVGMGKDVRAYIDDGAQVQARGDVVVEADAQDRLLALTGSVAFGGRVEVVGSLGVLAHISNTAAFIGDGTTVTADGSVIVSAMSELQFLPFAGQGAFGGRSAGIGVSNLTLVHVDFTEAYIGDDARVTARGNRPAREVYTGERESAFPFSDKETMLVAGLSVTATSYEDLLPITVGAVGAGNVALAGSGVETILVENTRASIGERTRINENNTGASADQTVNVLASDRTNVISLAGSVALAAQGVGIGFGADVGVLVKTTEASLDDATIVNAGRDVLVRAFSEENIVSFAVNAGGGRNGAGAGAINVWSLTTTTRAFIDDHARVRAEGNVIVAADSDARVALFAGGVGFAQYVGVGLSNTTLVKIDTTEAWIGANANVTALGLRSAVDVPTGEQNDMGTNATQPFRGLAVTATSFEGLEGAAVAAAGAQNAAIAAAGVVTTLVETTRATIEPNAQINADNSGAGTDQSVRVLAADDTRLLGAGGAGGVSIQPDPFNFGVGVGAGADVGVLVKTTEATVANDTLVNAAGNIQVGALNDEFVVSVAASAGIGGGVAVGIAGAAGIHAAVVTTRATVGKRSRVRADGSVVVEADDEADVITSAGNASGGLGGLGASIAASALIQTTEALIDEGATVIALGHKPGVAVRDGGYQIAFEAYGPFDVPVPQVNNTDLIDESLTSQRVATPQTKIIRGLAITATTSDEVYTIGLSGSAGAVAGSFAGGAHVSKVDTHAAIADGAKVNPASAGVTPNAEQSVLVAAGVDHFTLNLVGTAAGAAINSYGPALDAAVVLLDTQAAVGRASDDTTAPAGVEINAGKDLQVSAQAQEDVLVLTAGFAGSFSGTALSGGMGFYFLDSDTHAYLGNNVTASAGNNVLVSARDDTDTDLISGALSYAVGSGLSNTAAGGSIGTTVLLKDTQAYLGRNAVVDARANGNSTVGVYSGTIAGDDFATEQVRGVAVQASSREDVLAVSASGAVAIAGTVDARALAGAVTIQVIESDTKAFIGDNARVNQNGGAGAGQTVNVSAVNATEILAIDGSAAGTTLGALAGGLDVGVIRNNTSAYVGNGAQVSARGDVDIHALSVKDVESVAVSAAGAIVGLGGAASVYVLGSPFSSEALNGITSHDGSGNRVDTYADGENRIGDILGILGNYSETDQNGNDPTPDNNQEMGKAVRQARTAIDGRLPRGEVARAISSTEAPSGTSAFIGAGATVLAGRNVAVVAEESLDLHQVAGGAALGVGLGVGGSASVAVIGSQTSAFVGDGARVSAARDNSTPIRVGDVTIRAHLAEDLDGIGIAGGVGGLVGLGAQAVVLIDNSTQTAFVGNGAQITSAETVRVIAEADCDLDALSVGVSTGAITAGASVARAQAGGSTRAFLGDGARVGQEAGRFVRNLVVTADADTEAEARSEGASVGIVALTGSAAQALIHADGNAVQATIGQGAQVSVARDVTVSAVAEADAEAHAGGVNAGGINVGVSLAEATVRPTVTAAILPGSSVRTFDGTVSLSSSFNSRSIPLDKGASAEAEGISGHLIGGVGAAATATVAPVVETSLGGAGTTVNAVGSVHNSAQSHRKAEADAFGWSVGLGGSIGVSTASANVGGRTASRIEDGTEVEAGSRITSVVIVSGDADAETTAAAGGLILATQVNKATATVGQPGDSQASVGNNVLLQAGEDVTVRVFSQADARANAVGTAIGALAIGANVAGAVIAPDVEANIGDNAVVLAGGRITVDALHNTDISFEAPLTGRAVATAGASGKNNGAALENVSAGLIAATGAHAQAKVAPEVESRVAPGARLEAGGEIKLRSRSFNDADAASSGITAGIVGVGAILADAETGGHTRADLSAGLVKSASLTVTARGQGLAEADAQAATGGVLSGTGADADADVTSTVTATVGENVVTAIRGNVAITAESLADADADANGITVGVFEVGVALADARVTADVNAGVNPFAILNADGNVTITAAHNYDLASDLGRSDLNATAMADASGGGLIAGNGAHATTDSDVEVNSFIGGVSTVDAGGDIVIKARSSNAARAEGDGLTVGLLVGVGAVEADANVKGNTHASVGRFTAVRSGGLLMIDAVGKDTATARTEAAGGGLISGHGSDAGAVATSIVRASVGDNALVQATDVGLRADSDMLATVDATGETGGAIDVGVSLADASASAIVEAYIAHDANVTASDDLQISADSLGSSTATADGSLGSLIGDVGSDSRSFSTVTTNAFVGDRTRVKAGGDVVVLASARNFAAGDANNYHGGFIAEGQSTSRAWVANRTAATVGNGATVEAGGDFTLLSNLRSEPDAKALGSGSGFVDIIGSVAQAFLSHATLSTIGSGARVETGGTLQALSTSATTANAKATAGREGDGALFQDGRALAVIIITDPLIDPDFVDHPGDISVSDLYARHQNPTRTEVGTDAVLEARRVVLRADVTRIEAGEPATGGPPDGLENGMAVTNVAGGGAISDAAAKLAVVSVADVIVGYGTRIFGSESVELGARHGLVATYVVSDSDSDAAVNSIRSLATNVQFTRSHVDVRAGATVETMNLSVSAGTGQIVFDTLALAIGEFLDFETEIEDRRGRSENRIDFNGHATILPSDAAHTRFLIIDPDGTGRSGLIDPDNPTGIPQSGDFIPFSRVGDSIVVHNLTALAPNAVGTITFDVQLPTLSTDDDDDREDFSNNDPATSGLFGNGVFQVAVSPGDVSILNNSAFDLLIEGINPNTSAVQPQIRYLGALIAPSAYRHEVFASVPHTLPGPMDVLITNAGFGSQLYLAGRINNPLGSTTITSNWGDIFSADINAVVKSRSVRLETFVGDIGTTLAPIPVELTQIAGAVPEISGRAGDAMHLQVRGVTPEQRPVTVTLHRLDAAGLLDVNVTNGLVQSPSGAVSLTPTTVLVDHLGSSGGDVHLGTGSLADLVLSGVIVDRPAIQAHGTALLAVSDGAIRDDRLRQGTYIDAPTVLLQARTMIGTDMNALDTRAGILEAFTGTGGIWIANTGNLSVGGLSDLFFSGIRAGGGPVNLTTAGTLTLAENIVAPDRVFLLAHAIAQSSASAQVVTRDLVVAASAGDIGSSVLPFTFNAETLLLSTPPEVFNNNQYLREIDTVTVFPILDNVSGTTWLVGGTFLVNGLLQANAVKLSGGTLSGTGALGSTAAATPLEVLGGTVNPGVTTGVLHTSDITFRSGSTFHVDLSSPTQADQLQAGGRVELGGATLTGSVGADVQVGDSFTILTASGGVTGTFAQGGYAFLDGMFFRITYNPSSVVLTRRGIPVASAGGPYSIREGDSLTLDASATFNPNGDPLTYSWDVNGDGIFGDATGVTPTLTWAQLQALGINDGPGTFSVRILAQDGAYSSTSPAVSLGVANLAPTATVAGPTNGVRGQLRTLTLEANDPSTADQAAGFTYTINWGDGTPVQTIPASAGNGTGINVDHVYTRAGSFTVQVTATDKDGAVSEVSTHSFTIQVIELQGTVLAVGGTQDADEIEFKSAGAKGIMAEFNGVTFGPFAGVTQLAAFGQRGNDEIRLEGNIDLPALVDGGEGHDSLVGGKGNDVLLGGAGNDVIDGDKGDDFVDGGAGNDEVQGGKGNDILLGGAGADSLDGGNDRDLLIGGLGVDQLCGGSGDDILIGGTTDHDNNRAALDAIVAEWGREDVSYTTRVNHLMGAVGGGHNGSTFLKTVTVHDDGEKDSLWGESGLDWFFALMSGAGKDGVQDRRADEHVLAP